MVNFCNGIIEKGKIYQTATTDDGRRARMLGQSRALEEGGLSVGGVLVLKDL